MSEPTLREAAQALPCPFCGADPTIVERPDNIDGTEFFYAFACYCGGYSACAHKMAVRRTPEQAKADAIAEWNRRAALAASPAAPVAVEPVAWVSRGAAGYLGEPVPADAIAEDELVGLHTATQLHGLLERAREADKSTIAALEAKLAAAEGDAQLGLVALKFVDRAGDVHPGIDDAETICAEFYTAMMAVALPLWAARKEPS